MADNQLNRQYVRLAALLGMQTSCENCFWFQVVRVGREIQFKWGRPELAQEPKASRANFVIVGAGSLSNTVVIVFL